MENKYVKSTDVSAITIKDKKVMEIPYHVEKREKKSFWGSIIEAYQPEGYRLSSWATKDFYTKNQQEFLTEYNKRYSDSLQLINGVFYTFPSVTIQYKGQNQYPDTHYFETYDEAVKFAERLAGLCNLIAIFEK